MVNTRGYGGGKLHKQIVVLNNDPNTPKLRLGISGDVERFATIKPRHVRLFGNAGDTITQTVTIVPEKKYPFKILETKARAGQFIKYELKSEEGPAGTQYKLVIENTRQEKGRYMDSILLKTDSSIRPQLRVNVFGLIRDPNSGPSGKKTTPGTKKKGSDGAN